MRYVRLENAGIVLSLLGFGAWRAGGSWIYGLGEVDDRESMATMRRALEGGVNWIDTAPIYGYGHSEEVVGKVLKDFPEVLVNTKCGHFLSPDGKSTYVDLSPAAIRRDLEGSLRRLGRECIDIYQLHIPGPGMEEGWATLASLKKEGKVRCIGACNVDSGMLARLQAIAPADITEGVYNLLHRGLEQSLLPWARDHGVGVLVYEAQVTGLLTGAFSHEHLAELPADDYRHRAVDFLEPTFSRALELVEKLRPIAADLRLTVGQLAIAYAAGAPGVTGVMAGASTPEQVESWLPAGDLELTSEQREELTRLAVEAGFTPEADRAYAKVLDDISKKK